MSDPVVRWVYPDAEQYVESWPRFVDAFGGRAFESGTADRVEDFAAVALWLPPGVAPDEEAMLPHLYVGKNDSVRRDIDLVLGQMGSFHPRVEHWYLPLTGVDPVAQGRGLGSALLEHALARCDRDAMPAYLEATSPRSRALYARYGFDEIGVIQAGSSPPMWPMLRDPR
ncbi:MAG: GNAT family N-acetyltransferase [Acidimicrobiales bacterium]